MDFFGVPDLLTGFVIFEQQYPTWLIALTFSLASGLSLPLGACLGILVTPRSGFEQPSRQKASQYGELRKRFVGGCLAFGAGSLLFAVTVELYGKQMRTLENHGYVHHMVGITVTSLAAILGGVIYTYTNRWLCDIVTDKSGREHARTNDLPEAPNESTHLVGTVSEGDQKLAAEGSAAGLSMWLGVFIDGVPEGVLLGFLAAENHLSMALIVSLFISNFPEAFSSACLLREAGWPSWKILSIWTLCFVLTGVLAMIACAFCPVHAEVHLWVRICECCIEGLAGGAMLACITAVMLPEAYEIHSDAIGILCLSGFLFSVVLKVTGGVASELATKRHPLAEIHAGIRDDLSLQFFVGVGREWLKR
mmetsp:Transcript_107655/g.303236  ORF Transcript_107655/g.303236 Transcript_107655/m.303236 type:complete len:364 (-) Transcript_107655:128-1219(-)